MVGGENDGGWQAGDGWLVKLARMCPSFIYNYEVSLVSAVSYQLVDDAILSETSTVAISRSERGHDSAGWRRLAHSRRQLLLVKLWSVVVSVGYLHGDSRR